MNIKNEYSEKVKEFQRDLGNTMTSLCEKAGGLSPLFVVLSLNKVKEGEEPSYHTAFVPIAGEMLDSNQSKDVLVALLPMCIEHIAQDGNCIPLAVAWCTEVWMRRAPIDTPKSVFNSDEWRKFPKTEGIMCMIETEYSSDVKFWYMHREGKTTNSQGDLIDKIRLEERDDLASPDTVSGRFANIFRKYKLEEN